MLIIQQVRSSSAHVMELKILLLDNRKIACSTPIHFEKESMDGQK